MLVSCTLGVVRSSYLLPLLGRVYLLLLLCVCVSLRCVV